MKYKLESTKPSGAKGKYILSATLATTMGPGVRVDAGKAADREAAGAGTEETAEELATA